MNPTFDHDESAVLAAVLGAMPQGFAVPALNHKGLPDLGVPPAAARKACTRLRARGFVAKEGSWLLLSEAAMVLFADLARELDQEGGAS
jgi:hypothetical protein